MSQPSDETSDATFNTLLFAGLLVAGAVAGALITAHLIPESRVAAVAGTVMLPLGMIAGLSFGQKTAPTMAVLNLFAVFDGRHSVEDIIGRGGGSGGVLHLAFAIVAGTVIVALATAFGIDVFVKPEVAFVTLAKWFGGSALVFGVVSGALIGFLDA